VFVDNDVDARQELVASTIAARIEPAPDADSDTASITL
jgi:hypothetical protein